MLLQICLAPRCSNRGGSERLLYNRYYESFSDFREACEDFFNNPQRYHRELRSLLTENFALTG